MGERRGKPRLEWTEPMLTALKNDRAAGYPVAICAENVGVCYPTALRKCRELNIAERMNRGRRPGPAIMIDGRHA